eukprot:TRINITY_DN60329_c1_g1_i1.p1 TRINITY_DN60329_c1_g1~~TRINITY_DN60329_c1_g1_i1.p1  ORF type:complete len:597 (+),score=101.59 TRINITY_DN60329_c1_g1_i1:30-1793(+)
MSCLEAMSGISPGSSPMANRPGGTFPRLLANLRAVKTAATTRRKSFSLFARTPSQASLGGESPLPGRPKGEEEQQAQGLLEVVLLASCDGPTTLFPAEVLGRLFLAARSISKVVEEVAEYRLRREDAQWKLCSTVSRSTKIMPSARVKGIYPQRSHRFVPLASARATVGPHALYRKQRLQDSRVLRYAAAENYSVEVDERGQLFVWGRPGWMERAEPQQRCSLEHRKQVLQSQSRPKQAIVGPCGPDATPRLVSVAASRHALLALTQSGHVMFARVRRSPSHTVDSVELLALRELEGVRIVSVTTRFGQAFAVADDGSVYAWGLKSGDIHRPENSCSMGFGDIATQLTPSPLPMFGGQSGQTRVRSVVAGVSHTLFVCETGDVYAVGRMEHGKLGLGTQAFSADHILVPERIPGLYRIVAAAAGLYHSLFLADDGVAYGCGMTKEGQLPGDSAEILHYGSPAWTVFALDLLPCFCVSLAAGISCSFFVSDGGKVYLSGTTRQTNRPFGRKKDVLPSVPYLIPKLRGIKKVSLSMELSFYQWEHALFITREDKVFGWGHAGHGELPGAHRQSPGDFVNRVFPVDMAGS